MNSIKPTMLHLRELMTWFQCESSLRMWSGPFFRYPFTETSFVEDLTLDKLTSMAIVSESGALMAFGQYYLRVGRCHLGRLVVAPELRGKGVVSELIDALTKKGLQDLAVSESSLFVLMNNKAAISAYERIGFARVEYPDKNPLEDCLYMIKSHENSLISL